jgi:hypothetical protein
VEVGKDKVKGERLKVEGKRQKVKDAKYIKNKRRFISIEKE